MGTDISPLLIERVRVALAPHYTVERVLARGGMGIVFLGHDRALDRPVAIKILQPELASAEYASRFLREARVLAKLSHPNIVPVYQAEESGGIYYYIMQYVEGETLQRRLLTGRLKADEAIAMGADLLAALAAAHRQKWLHRDVKPGNIFVTPDRTILADFGIAKPMEEAATALTDTKQVLGTLSYMAPEQLEGKPATEQSDIYAVGIVLYEALTGVRWWSQSPGQPANWSGIPRRLARIIRKALCHDPTERWQDAASFRLELIRAGTARHLTPIVTGLAVLLVVFAVPLIRRRDSRQSSPAADAVSLEMLDGSASSPAVADSISRALAAGLAGYPDISVTGPFPRNAPELARSAIVLAGVVDREGEMLRVRIHSRGPGQPITTTVLGTAAGWHALADSVIDKLLYQIYQGDTPFLSTLPAAALPKTATGYRAWLDAEKLFTQARWGEAATAYEAAEAADSSCLLCSFRVSDIDRWLDRSHDRPSRMARLQANIDSFPPQYRALIQAASTRWPDRLTILETATGERDFFLAWFEKGDELFHRGPLYLHRRAEAKDALEQTVRMRPDFLPGWEHLAWLRIAEGDSAGAAAALHQLQQSGEPRDTTSIGLRALLFAGFAYRFLPAASGNAVVSQSLSDPRISSFPDLPMAPRLLLTFDAPEGAVAMGRMFSSQSDARLIRAGLLARVFGHLAMGQVDSSLAVARMLKDRVADPDLELFGTQLAAALVMFDGDSSGRATSGAAAIRESLRRYTLPEATSKEIRTRAAWMLALLSRRAGLTEETENARRVVGHGEGASYFETLLAADEQASRRNYERALVMTAWDGDSLSALPDPFFSTFVHFLRADWYAQLANDESALKTLLWHEANNFAHYPTHGVQSPEVDFAFGTLARWRRARLLDRPGSADPESACREYADVARLWANGDRRYRARADSARARVALHCLS